jgi:hypothetical protein
MAFSSVEFENRFLIQRRVVREKETQSVELFNNFSKTFEECLKNFCHRF